MPFGDIASIATKLLDMIANSTGIILEPWRLRNKAKAEADGMIIIEEAKLKIKRMHQQFALEPTETQLRGLESRAREEGIKQENMESIFMKALPDLEEDAQPGNLSNEWLLEFFEKCRNVTTDDMQDLWARLLSGEVNNPGSYSKRTLHLLKSMTSQEAEDFQFLCQYVWQVGNERPLLIYKDIQYPSGPLGRYYIWTLQGKFFLLTQQLNQFANIGLLQFDKQDEIQALISTPVCHVSYQDRILPMRSRADTKLNNLPAALYLSSEQVDKEALLANLNVGHVALTEAGSEIYNILRPTFNEGFYLKAIERWKMVGFEIPDQGAPN